MAGSLKILSLLSFCYFLIWTSNLSLKACCCYRRRLFCYAYLEYMFLLMCIIWGISTFYMHLCSLSPIYRARCAQRKGISCIFLKKHQFVMFIFGNLCKSRHVSRYLSLSRHTESLQNPAHGSQQM